MKAALRFRQLSIRSKMIIAFLGVSIVSVLLLGFSSHYYYSRAVKNNFLNISYEATNRLNYFMEYYFQEFQRSSTTLISSDTIQRWLTSEERSNADIDRVESELRRYVALNFPEIRNMFLVSADQEVVSMQQTFAGKNDYLTAPWFGHPLQRTAFIMPTHIAEYQGGQGEGVMSVMLPIFGIDSQELIGNLIIDISLSEIHEAFTRSRLGQTGQFFIVSDDDTIVYHADYDWNGLPRSRTGLKDLNLSGDPKASIQSFQGTDYLIASVTSASTNWKIISMVPFAEMAEGLNSATKSMLIVLLSISVFILLVVPLLSARFVQPIIQLKKLMRQVAGGNLSVRSDSVPGSDEFQQLNHSFNIMVSRLEELFNTNVNLKLRDVQSQLLQKEALIRALQNQINPHLLYNSLGIIQSMAYLEQMPMIEKMARNLADLYRYTARFNGKETTLRMEVVHLQKYLEIIHVRFPSDFQSYLYVNEKFMSHPVLKLILQPILENAVKYAVEPMEGKGAIIVSAYDTQRELVIEIADNGPGIEQDKLTEIREKLGRITAQETVVDEDGESLGIANVHARIVLRYGSGYGVAVDSFVGRGTVVSIRLPLIKPLPGESDGIADAGERS